MPAPSPIIDVASILPNEPLFTNAPNNSDEGVLKTPPPNLCAPPARLPIPTLPLAADPCDPPLEIKSDVCVHAVPSHTSL